MKKKIIIGILLLCAVLLSILFVAYHKKNRNEISEELAGNKTPIASVQKSMNAKKLTRKTGPTKAKKNVSAEQSLDVFSEELHIKEFGEKTSKPINSGFVFYDGQYIDMPYSVSQKGLGTFINDVRVDRPLIPQWPMPDPGIPEDPGLFPQMKSLSKDTSFDEFDKLDEESGWHTGRTTRYLLQHFTQEEVTKRMIEYYRSLPFVKNVIMLDSCSFHLETFSGEERNIDVSPPEKGSQFYWMAIKAPSKEELLPKLEDAYSYQEKELKSGECTFFFSNGQEFSLSPERVFSTLPNAIDVLKSDMTYDEKIDKLKELDFFACG